jgi:hypothetical protein
VSNAGSLAECLKSCLLAEIDFGFVCKSLMYYPADQDQVKIIGFDQFWNKYSELSDEFGKSAHTKGCFRAGGPIGGEYALFGH